MTAPEEQDHMAKAAEGYEDNTIEVVCLECGHKFSAEDPDECENCGSSDLDLA